MIVLLIGVLSYLLGSFPTAYLIVKYATGKDIRQVGTGNVGAMNTARATGKWYLFISVFLIDALKGSLPVLVVSRFMVHDLSLAIAIASFGVVLGHCYSLYFKMRDGKFAGGKAIACLFGVLTSINFLHLFIPWVGAMIIPILLTGNLFLGQFVGTLALPVIGIFFPQYFLVTFLIAIPIFIKQWPRVIPMLKGKEPKWYFKLPTKKS